MESLGKVVLTDIAIICFDDNNLFRLASPGITVVSQSIKAIGNHALSILLDQIDEKQSEPERVVLKSS